MVYSVIQVVYGVVIDQELFLSLFGDSLRKLRAEDPDLPKWDPTEYQKIQDEFKDYSDPSADLFEAADGTPFSKQLCIAMDLCDSDVAIDLYWNFIQCDTDVVFLHPSKNAWIVGMLLERIPLNKGICVEELKGVTQEDWVEFAERYGLTSDPRTFLLIDDD